MATKIGNVRSTAGAYRDSVFALCCWKAASNVRMDRMGPGTLCDLRLSERGLSLSADAVKPGRLMPPQQGPVA